MARYIRQRTLAKWMEAYGWTGDDAITEYQDFHGLKADGEIGPVTERHVLIPRICGHPDRMPYLGDGGAHRIAKFPTNEISVLLDNEGFPGFTLRKSTEILQYCLDHWAAVADLEFDFVSTSMGNKPVIRITAGRIDGPLGTLAWSNLAPTNPVIQKYDDAERWVYVGNPQPNVSIPMGRIEIAAVVIHELGHALGIDHAPAALTNGIMRPTYDQSVRKPQPGYDIDEVQKRYGPPANQPVPDPDEPDRPDDSWGPLESCLRNFLGNRKAMAAAERLVAGTKGENG